MFGFDAIKRCVESSCKKNKQYEIKKRVQKLIEENKIEEAFQSVQDHMEKMKLSSKLNDLTILKCEYLEVQRKDRLGMATPELEGKKSRIKLSILEMVDSLEDKKGNGLAKQPATSLSPVELAEYESNERMSTFSDLVNLAISDGQMDSAERNFLIAVGQRLKLTQEEINKVIYNPYSIKLTFPSTPQKKVMKLIDAVLLMMVDGRVDERELTLCVKYAIEMGFNSKTVDVLMKAIVESARRRLPPSDIFSQVKGLLPPN